MESKELIEIIRADVAGARDKGVSSIPVENLFAYLDEIEKNPDHPANQLMLATELEDHKADLARQLMERTENFKAVILLGQNTLKGALLINGGAAVALLAFIGQAWKPESETPLIGLAESLAWFVGGTWASALATGGTYVAQTIYALYGESREKMIFKGGVVFHLLVVLLMAASYGMFARGAWDVYDGLVNYRAAIQRAADSKRQPPLPLPSKVDAPKLPATLK